MPSFCSRHESGWKLASTIFLPITEHVLRTLQLSKSKNSENRGQNQTRLGYAEVHPVFAESNDTGFPSLKNQVRLCAEKHVRSSIGYKTSVRSHCFSASVANGVFAFFKCEIPKGLMVGLQAYL